MTSALHGFDAGLSAVDLTISYDSRPAVHHAGFTVEPGKVTAFIGPNGSGKSTLLRTVARLHRPDSGSVTLGDGVGERVDALALSSRDFAKRVTLLTQGRPTPGGTTVKEVVDYGRHPHRSRWTAKDPAGASVVDRAMRLTNTHELTNSPVAALSGGQLQRVWLASCLAQDTQVLLLDEPTTYLDLRYQVEILDVIRDLAVEHGVAVGVVLHDLNQAAAIADHLVLLEAGTITAAGSAAQVLTTENLTRAFGVRVDVTVDAATGSLTTRAVGRHTYLSLSH